MTIITAVFVVSCSNDPFDNYQGSIANSRQSITFKVNTQDWQGEGLTRAATALKEIPMSGASDIDACLVPTIVNSISSFPSPRETAGVTRGTVVTAISGAISITAYTYNNTETWGTQTPDAGFYDETATNTMNGWATSNAHLWPEDVSKTMQFFAYAPQQSDNGISLSAVTTAGTPYIDFTVDNDISSQTDLMVATSGPMNKRNQKVDLPFRHALTCVRFAVGSNISPSGTIKEIRLKNIAKEGRYHFDGNWTDFSSPEGNYTITGINTSTSSTGTVVTGTGGVAGSTLLMIPQQFTSDDQKVEVDIATGSGTQTISAILNGTQWQPGTTVTYNISGKSGNWDYVLTVTPAQASYHGGETTFSVTSYRQNANGSGKTAVPWKITGYSTDGGTTFTSQKPEGYEWLHLMTKSGNGGTAEEYGTIAMDEQTASSTSGLNETNDIANQATQMRNNPTRGTSTSYYDLSTHDYDGNPTPMNTANCYIVNAPGYYKIPLVYGNAIVNGQPNPIAYEGVTGLAYQDHDGQVITSPYLYLTRNSAYTIASAQVVWQDELNLVTNVSLSSDKHYVQFYVNPNNIKQGNVVIGVRSSTTYTNQLNYMWSWHIWFTNTDMTKTIPVKNHEGYIYRFLPVNLGWCSKGSTQTTYPARSLIVKVQQQNGKTANLVIRQQETKTFTNSTVGTNTYYQSRRKDPFPYGTQNGGTKTVYGTYTKTEGQKGVPWGIRNPSDFRYVTSASGLRDWLNTNNAVPSLWCANYVLNTTDDTQNYCNYKVIKTIYDPSPVGFKVPPPRAISGFSTTGESSTSASQINGTVTSTGCNFRTGFGDETIYFPKTGRMAWESGTIASTESGRIWTAIPYNTTSGNTLNITDTQSQLSNNAHLGVGLPVRPIIDE